MANAVATNSPLYDPIGNNVEILKSSPPSAMEIDQRLHALIDIGDFLLGFTIEDIEGAHAARARVFEMHTRSWLPVAVPILPSEMDGDGLPIDGKWEMRMIEDTTILCIYSNPSRCRLIYIHVDRQPTGEFPLSLFITRSHNIRPIHPSLAERAFNCMVLYSRNDGVENVSVVTDDNQFDRDSVRVFDMNEAGVMVEIGTCNLTNTLIDFVLARSASGDIVLTNTQKQAISIDRTSGYETLVEIGICPKDASFPTLKSSFYFCEYRSFVVDVNGRFWSLDANRLVWNKHRVKPFSHGRICSLSLSPKGRILGFEGFRRQRGNYSYKFEPVWRWIQPPSLKESTQDKLSKSLVLDDVTTEDIQTRMKTHRRSYDTTNAYILSITEGPKE